MVVHEAHGVAFLAQPFEGEVIAVYYRTGEVKRLPVERATSLALSPDGATLFVAQDIPRRITSIDPATFTVRSSVTTHLCPYSLAVAASRLWVAERCQPEGGSYHLYTAELAAPGALVSTGLEIEPYSRLSSPGPTAPLLGVISNGTPSSLAVYRPVPGEPQLAFQTATEALPYPIHQVSWTRNGDRVLVGTSMDPGIAYGDTLAVSADLEEQLGTFPAPGHMLGGLIDPDGTHVVIGGGNRTSAGELVFFDADDPTTPKETVPTGPIAPGMLRFADGGDLLLVVERLGNDGNDIFRVFVGPSQRGISTVSLSSLTPRAAINGWGPWERDRSNGEDRAGDGRPLTLDGQVYATGLGVHAHSRLTYDIPEGCTRFTATVGVDDEVGDRGGVAFEVWADGTRLAETPPMTGATAARELSVALDARQLELIVVDANANPGSDHADWADARFSCGASSDGSSTSTTTPAGSSVWLSSLTPSAAVNGWGPWERNRSNGEDRAGDGRPLTLDGRVYESGLGVHANSRLTYDLPDRCTQFAATVGLDDEVGDLGSVTFEVWADGTRLASTPPMTGASTARELTVPLDGQRRLELAVLDANANLGSDHADWADARLTCAASGGTTTSTTVPDTSTLQVSTLTPTAAVNGWGPWERNRSNGEDRAGDGRPLTLDGRVYTSGLGVHAASRLTYDLPAGCTRFEATVGIDDEVGDLGNVMFEVWADGTRLASTPPMTGASTARGLTVPLDGRRQLELVVLDANANPGSDHADWADARLTCAAR